ncbi:MAG: hypothetical protein BWY63_03229 [Chloroflexi bacterium ADurb.Bin360]|nr:MAG: hypothetical protein BWY63_03229 [Chloroflexi bacterium ADurb.Bin360]
MSFYISVSRTNDQEALTSWSLVLLAARILELAQLWSDFDPVLPDLVRRQDARADRLVAAATAGYPHLRSAAALRAPGIFPVSGNSIIVNVEVAPHAMPQPTPARAPERVQP